MKTFSPACADDRHRGVYALLSANRVTVPGS
jgi:hypothetical protein